MPTLLGSCTKYGDYISYVDCAGVTQQARGDIVAVVNVVSTQTCLNVASAPLYQTTRMYITATTVIPAGVLSYDIANLGENAAGLVHHDWAIDGFTMIARILASTATTETGGLFGAITVDPNPGGAAIPNTIYIQYTAPV